ncbi:hypothetical protein P5673_025212 [Acropora cervicornis]|uniref:Uncharacterized protein n=1 Tax=Acropora cervicornis TaxID=6130 RepID=A0AAD9Q2I7_ACRCE|nr:hypothetical protein P5673_025212 [Acropora cervicornis]
MMADKNVHDEITKLRLKLLEQKLRSQLADPGRGSNMPAAPSNSSIAGIQNILQAETLKSQQLLERVKEERVYQKKQSYGNHKNEDHSKDMMTMMTLQNMQLQQLMLQQMMSSPNASTKSETTEKEKPAKKISPASKPLETEAIGHREMTPFTTSQSQTRRVDSAPSVSGQTQPVSAQRKPSTRTGIPRGVATPVRPTQRVPEPRPRPHASMQPAGFIGEMARSNPVMPYPFPGPRGARKLRHYGYAAWACFILISLLRKLIQRRLEAAERLNNLINQAIDELHSKYYLEREGAMYAIFQDAIRDDAFDLKVKAPGVFQRLSQESQAAIRDLTSMIENIVYRVLQIRPTTGLLSTSRESVLWEMTQVGVLLPQNYLWHVEQENITFGVRGELVQVNKQISAMLLLGLFISRALVSTLLLKPVECGLMEATTSNLAASNLKVLATIFMKIVRDVSLLPSKRMMENLRVWAEDFLDALDRS